MNMIQREIKIICFLCLIEWARARKNVQLKSKEILSGERRNCRPDKEKLSLR